MTTHSRKADYVFAAMLVWLGLTTLDVEPASAQTATLRGFVTDDTNGESLPGANVALENSDGALFGSVSDNDGFYAVGRLGTERFILRVSFVGYVTYRDTLQFTAGELRSLDVALVPSSEELDELIVDAERTAGVTRVTAGLQSVLPADIDRIPGPDISGDLVMLLTALPGVVTVGDQGGQIYIRGGEPWQNLVLLDGMLIYQPFHILGFFSAFPSDILNVVDIYASGYGARYGGRLSSVIDISTRNGNNRKHEGALTLSPFIVGLQAEGPLLGDGKVSFLTSIRKSVVEDGAARLIDRPVPFDFSDIFLKLHGTFGHSSRLSLTHLRTYDRGRVGEDVGQTPLSEVRWSNRAYGLRYIYLPGELPMLAEIMVSYSKLESELGPDQIPIRSSSAARYNTSADVTFYGGRLDVRWGLFVRSIILSSDLGGLFQNLISDKEYLTEVGIYVEPEFKPISGIRLAPSLRVHSFPSKSETFVEPRFRAVWENDIHQVSASLGIYHQETIGISDRRDATSVFTAWRSVPRSFGVPRAVNSTLGYGLRPGRGFEFSIEGYHKNLQNLFIAEWSAFPRLTTRIQPADGRVIGVDMRVELRTSKFYGYVNYGLSSVEYEAKQASLELWFGTPSYKFRPGHDRRHQINVLATTSLFNIDLSARWQFGSGLPYNRALGFDGFVLMDDAIDVFEVEGARRVIYERPFNGILPTYHRLDLSAERVFDAKYAKVTVQASALNVYDRSNIFYLDVFTLRRADQLPFIPSLGIKIESQ